LADGVVVSVARRHDVMPSQLFGWMRQFSALLEGLDWSRVQAVPWLSRKQWVICGAAVSRILLSHSSVNNAEAVAVRNWMAVLGWNEVFLDLDPERGLKAGDRWQEALKSAARRCELVLVLISPEWRRRNGALPSSSWRRTSASAFSA
jgi:transposase-like protein